LIEAFGRFGVVFDEKEDEIDDVTVVEFLLDNILIG
jgi:hypothetical protein